MGSYIIMFAHVTYVFFLMDYFYLVFYSVVFILVISVPVVV